MVFKKKPNSKLSLMATGEQKKIFKKMNMRERLAYMKQVITIEPLICCVVIAKVICAPAITNLHFEKACKVNAGFNDTVCEAIVSGTYLTQNFREQNNMVQSYLTQTRSWEVPVSSVVPVLLILFVGSYSDLHKIRKPFLLMPIFGDMVALIGTILNIVYMYSWPLEAQVVADRVIPSIFGSEKLVITIAYAYIADVSTPEMRTIRMAVIPIILSVCIPVVHAISGILFKLIGYIPILSIGFVLFVIAFFYGIFVVKEPRKCTENNKKLMGDIFNVQHVTDTFKLLIKLKGTQRTNFICILVLSFIQHTVSSGEGSAFYLFVQTAYQWTVVDFSYLISVSAVVKFIGLAVMVPLFVKAFKLTDVVIIMISYTDAILVSTVIVAIKSSVGVYLGSVLSVVKPPGHAATRSQITKCVSTDDMGKAAALTTIIGTIAAILAAEIYHQGIYEYTRTTFPEAFLLFGIAMHLVAVGILLWLYYAQKKNKEYDVTIMENENEITDVENIDKNEILEQIETISVPAERFTTKEYQLKNRVTELAVTHV